MTEYCPCCGIPDGDETKPHEHDSSCIWFKEEKMNWQKKAYIMIGPSGSGKSTVSQALAAKHADSGVSVKKFSLDDCRIRFYLENSEDFTKTDSDLYRKAFDFAKGKEFDDYVQSQWKLARDAQIVIVDNVHGTRKSRRPWVDALKKDKFHITMVQVQTPLEVVLERQNTRYDKHVPADIVRQMYMRQEEAMVGDECDALMVIDGTRPVNV